VGLQHLHMQLERDKVDCDFSACPIDGFHSISSLRQLEGNYIMLLDDSITMFLPSSFNGERCYGIHLLSDSYYVSCRLSLPSYTTTSNTMQQIQQCLPSSNLALGFPFDGTSPKRNTATIRHELLKWLLTYNI